MKLVPERGEVTAILARVTAGDKAAEDSLIELVYPELHRLALARLRPERRDHTLQPTALVNEAYLKLCGAGALAFRDRAHFYRVAARIMRRILVDYGRKRRAKKRGQGFAVVPLDETAVGLHSSCEEHVEISDLIDKLAEINPRAAEVAEMHLFGDMTEDEIAAVLESSAKTAQRAWKYARGWMQDQLNFNGKQGGRAAEL